MIEQDSIISTDHLKNDFKSVDFKDFDSLMEIENPKSFCINNIEYTKTFDKFGIRIQNQDNLETDFIIDGLLMDYYQNDHYHHTLMMDSTYVVTIAKIKKNS